MPHPRATVRPYAVSGGCPVASVVLLLPGRGPVALGPVATSRVHRAGLGRLVYRSGGTIVTGSAASTSERACTRRGPAGAHVALTSVSLLGGAVTAARVTLTRGSRTTAAVSGLGIAGKRIATKPGARMGVPGIGYLTVGPGVRLPLSPKTVAAGALAVHLVSARAGLPAGTTIVVGAVALPAVPAGPRRHLTRTHGPRRHGARKNHRPRATGQPLTVTPPLALRRYMFPVAGPSDYGDTYGGFRSDVPGNWHHGDDIFAPLGTPVVAVATGTINRVGWEKLGGWRLWVRDAAGDEFYYAHLSGYAPADLRSNRVRAGDVIGFVGNTGDAFTTDPHLHFEIHPRPLLHLGYNGAVDPTTYLEHWTHLSHVAAPHPVHPPLPGQPQLRDEARYVFRELLAARHLIRRAPPKLAHRPPSRPATRRSAPARRDAARAATPVPASPPASGSTATLVLVVGLGGIAAACVAGGAAAARRLRRRGA